MPGFKQISEALSHPSAELTEASQAEADAEHLRQECRAMLLAGLPFSLCVFQDQRRVASGLEGTNSVNAIRFKAVWSV